MVSQETPTPSLFTISVNKLSQFSPLFFLPVTVRSNDLPDSNPVSVSALFDTGANAVFLSKQTYQNICPFRSTLTRPSKPAKVKIADSQTQLPVQGFASVTFTLTDINQCQLHFSTMAVVIDSLQHHMYLGNALLLHEHFSHSTSKGLFFSPLAVASSTTCQEAHFVPFHVHRPLSSQASHLTVVFGTTMTPGQVGKVLVQANPPLSSYPQDVIVTGKPSGGIHVVPQVHTLYSAAPFPITLQNTNPADEVTLYPEEAVADIQLFDSLEFEATTVTMVPQEEQEPELYVQYLDPDPHPEPILQHLLLDDQKLVKDTLDAQGCCQIPVTTITDRIDNAGAFALKTFPKRASNEEIFKLLNLSHLDSKFYPVLRKLLKHYRDCFAADMYELSATDVVHLDYTPRPNVNLSDLHVQFKPIPEADKPEARQILQQMQDAGIISPLKQNITIISNLLTRRKKSGKLRMILDNRLANAYSTKIPDLGSHPLLIATSTLRKAKTVTTTDFANSYFQIPTTPALAGIAAFRGPDRDLFQMNRAAQGYINSACALNIAVYLMTTLPVTTGELSGVIPLEYFTLADITSAKIKTLRATVPHIHIGNAKDTHTYTTGRPISTFTNQQLKNQKLVTYPPSGGTLNYMDDLVLHNAAYPTRAAHQLNPLIQDLIKATKQMPAAPDTAPDIVSVTSRAGARVETGPCEHCLHNDNTPLDWDNFYYHLAVLELTLCKLRKARMTISPDKTFIATNRIEFLGLIWQPNRLSVDKVRLAAFDKLPIHSHKTLRSAIGSIAYHRTQIPGFSRLAQPLLDLLKQPKFVWLPEHQQAWDSIKQQLRINSTVHTFDPNKPIVLSTDASYHACSAHIYQKCGAHARLVACASRSFTKAELPRSIIQKEVDAVTYAAKIFQPFLANANDITLEIDSRAIIFVALCNTSNTFLSRLSAVLSEMGISKIVHCPSAFHEPADSLSRLTALKFKFPEIADLPALKPEAMLQILDLLHVPPGTILDADQPETYKPFLEIYQKIIAHILNTAHKPQNPTLVRQLAAPQAPTKPERKITKPYTVPRQVITPKGPFRTTKKAKEAHRAIKKELKTTAKSDWQNLLVASSKRMQ